MKFNMMKDLVLCAPKDGANLRVTTADGEFLCELGFLPGLHRVRDLGQYFPEDAEYELLDGVFLFRGNRMRAVKNPRHTETGANQTFQPSVLTDHEKEMRRIVRRLQDRVDGMARRAAHAERLVRQNAERDERDELVDREDERNSPGEEAGGEPLAPAVDDGAGQRPAAE
jgi:hypothetical protein